MAGITFEKIKAKLDGISAGYAEKVARVGWFPNAQYEDGTNVAYVAAIQEYGAPEVSIPPRPFVKPAIDHHKTEWGKVMADGVKASAAGSKVDADGVLFAVGALAASDIQLAIETGQFQPLSPVTILLRKWRREGRTITGKTVGEAAAAIANGESIEGVNADPLRDTGLLIASVRNDVSDA